MNIKKATRAFKGSAARTNAISASVRRATSARPVLKRNTVAVNTVKWDHVKAELGKATRVRVGVLASRGGNAKHEGSDLSLIDIAHVHEFGAPAVNVPERSFIRRSLSPAFGGGAWLPAFTARLAKSVLAGKMDMTTALTILGQRGVAEVRRTITTGAGIPPALKPETIKRKGSSRPLVDTGQLINSISYELIFGEAAAE